MRDHLADLVSKSMTAIRDQGLLTCGVSGNVLPNVRDKIPFLSFTNPSMNRLVTRHSGEEKLTPMKQGGHAPAAEYLSRGSGKTCPTSSSDNDLATILGKNDRSPPMWIANPPQRYQREDHFLSMLNISDVGFQRTL